nr:hypothetical protein Iba_chr11bCG11870 [Ipomoea batatas]
MVEDVGGAPFQAVFFDGEHEIEIGDVYDDGVKGYSHMQEAMKDLPMSHVYVVNHETPLLRPLGSAAVLLQSLRPLTKTLGFCQPLVVNHETPQLCPLGSAAILLRFLRPTNQNLSLLPAGCLPPPPTQGSVSSLTLEGACERRPRHSPPRGQEFLRVISSPPKGIMGTLEISYGAGLEYSSTW